MYVVMWLAPNAGMLCRSTTACFTGIKKKKANKRAREHAAGFLTQADVTLPLDAIAEAKTQEGKSTQST